MSRHFVLLLTTLLFTVAFAGCEGDTGPAGPQGPPGVSTMLGYAGIDATSAADPEVFGFGGAGTDSVTVQELSEGNHNVTFHGTYPGLASTSELTVLATVSDTNNYHVASASMDQGSASETAIVVRVFQWSTRETPNPLENADFSVIVMR